MTKFRLDTQFPVAYESLDHTHPFGTIRDNHSNTNFVTKLVDKDVTRVLDIGCAGGGFVKECLDIGIQAVGVEGSDINLKTQRAEWATIPDNLFTADATKPFSIMYGCSEGGWDDAYFHVVTAWEFFEHIEANDLRQVMDNIIAHTLRGSLLICSIANFPSPHEGVELHRTQQDDSFWLSFFLTLGFERDTNLEQYFAPDWVRHGTYNFVLRRIR